MSIFDDFQTQMVRDVLMGTVRQLIVSCGSIIILVLSFYNSHLKAVCWKMSLAGSTRSLREQRWFGALRNSHNYGRRNDIPLCIISWLGIIFWLLLLSLLSMSAVIIMIIFMIMIMIMHLLTLQLLRHWRPNYVNMLWTSKCRSNP